MRKETGMEKVVRIYISPGSRCPRKMKRTAAYRLEARVRGAFQKLNGSVEMEATANSAELLALSAALKHFQRSCRIVIHTKSAYVANAFNRKWAFQWAASEWKNSKGKPVANQREWREVLKELKGMAFKVVLEEGAG